MLLSERIREIGADEARITEENVRVARQALTREIARSARPERARRRHRVWAGIGIGGLVAGTAVTAIVVGSVLAPVEAPSASAAEVFETAAEVVEAGEPAVLAAGQFTRIDVVTDYLVANGSGGVPRDPDADAGFIERTSTVYYVPADRSDDWYVDETAPRDVVEMIGEGADEFLASVRAGGETRSGEIVAYPAGNHPIGDYPIAAFADLYDTLPRDPQQLLAWATEAGGESKTLMDLVWLDLPPADLRSAAYRALALLPGFTVTSTEGDLTTLERRTDLGLGETYVGTLTVDMSNGQMRSYTSSILQETGDGIAPAGVPDMRMTFTSTVVDAAP